jgi:type VI secretion system protein ImpK
MEPANPNDPFAQLEEGRTFIKPNPGARTGSRAPDSPTQLGAAPADEPLPEAGLNPLVALANKLLIAVPQIRHTRSVADVAALRNNLAQSIRDFATEATARGIAPERVMAARYVLCTVLDETAADTPWGGSGVWANHSLLASFHNETFGGDKVFQLMARLAEKPAANRDLLELIYAVLSLGFEGRYRVADNGRAQLEAVRAKLAQILKKERGDYPAALAQHWQGQPAQGKRALSWLPLTVAAVLGLLLVGGAYVGFSWSLGGLSDPVYGQIQNLRLAPPVEPVPLPAPKPRLAQFLQADIKAQLVAVRDDVDRSVITVRGDGLFAPASATLVPEREALMKRIAEALAAVQGTVLVTGHTDSVPIRTARFPSNWHLSEERARSVAQLLIASGVPAERVRAEGRADGEAVAPNDTPANRALNRRVEITLVAGSIGAPVRPAAASGATR